jgi:hypothetical protein
LTKRVNGTTKTIFSRPFALVVGRHHEVVFEALGDRLRVGVDGTQFTEAFDGDLSHGSVGFYTWGRPLPRFDRVVVEGVTRKLDAWAIHDHGGVLRASVWQIDRRALVQTADLLSSNPSAAALDHAGSAAIIGDADWTDVKVTTIFDMPRAGAAGVVFRWQDADNHYRLIFDAAAGQQRLVRRRNGTSTVLWSAVAALTSITLVVEAIRDRLRAWVGSALLFDVYDDALTTGRAGPLAFDGGAAVWSLFDARHVRPKWEDWHTFDAAFGWRAAGRRVRVFAGRQADATLAPDAGAEHQFQETSGAFLPRLRSPAVDLRILDAGGRERHRRRFLPDAAYTPVPSARVLRAADGTGMLVFVPGAGPAGTELLSGEYRLSLTYRRDNTTADPSTLVLSQAADTSNETAIVDIPWTLSP